MAGREGLWRDAARLAVGTLTVLPVAAPTRVDAAVAGRAMTLAPAVGLLGGTLAAAALGAGSLAGTPPLAVAAVALAALAWSSRLLHLDGVADLADGLAVQGPAERALEVMRRGDAGPAGVVALVLTLLTQAALLAGLAAVPLLGALAVMVSRLALTWACSLPLPSARPGGLGSNVARTVRPAAALAATLAVTAVGALTATLAGAPWWAGPAAVAGGAVGASWTLTRARRRLGGITGDVLGSTVECALTGALAALVLACTPR